MAGVNKKERSAKIEAMAVRLKKKFGDSEIVKLNSIAVTNVLIAKGIINEDEYQNELLNLLSQNVDKIL